jgi:hypothetical protein
MELMTMCLTEGWMTKLTEMGWIQVVWNRKHIVMFRKYRMLVLDTFIGYSKPHAMNTTM